MPEPCLEGKLERFLDKAILVIGCCMVFYHLFATQYLFQNPMLHGDTALFFSLILVFLGTIISTKRLIPRLLCVTLLIAGIFATVYFHMEFDRLELIIGFPERMDVIIGIVLIIVVIEATRQAFGWILPVVAILFIAYFFLGHLIPGPLGHGYFETDLVVSYLSVGFTGVFNYLPVVANMIFLFVVFGALIQTLGAHKFIFEVGKWVGRTTAGGIGQTAVVGSTMVGMFTGVGIANVAITGAFTIPMMKASGYEPEDAAAIESTASTGAQLVPPVMGVAAFLMAYLLNMPYYEIMLAAIIPAGLFYLSIFIGVEVIARKLKVRRPVEKVDIQLILRRAPLFLFPIGVITALLVMRYSPSYASFYAIMSLIAISLFQKETRPSFSTLARGIANGAVTGAKIVVAVGLVGVLTQTLVTTGLGIKLGLLVETLAGENLFLLLFLSMIICIILGCGMPPVAAYMIVAMVVCPILTRMGVEPLAAHFFAFYYAILSAVTPPVAVCALAACAIADAKFLKTCWKAFVLSFIGLILPYLWVYNHSILGRFSSLLDTIFTLIAAIASMITLSALSYGYLQTRVPIWGRLLCTVAMVISLWSIVSKNYLLFFMGLFLFVPVFIQQWKSRSTLEPVGG